MKCRNCQQELHKEERKLYKYEYWAWVDESGRSRCTIYEPSGIGHSPYTEENIVDNVLKKYENNVTLPVTNPLISFCKSLFAS
jgi:hypothetical protein